METKDKARILIKKDGRKVIYIPSFELEIFEGDLRIIEKENRRLTKELKLMTVNASALQGKVQRLGKQNKELVQVLARKEGALNYSNIQ